jgi:hypothetical protein
MLESDERIRGGRLLLAEEEVNSTARWPINLQGYGADLHFNAPYEFAVLPHEVLYSMAIGMVIRKTAMQLCGPLDAALIKWYEDTELGIRLWKLGFRVVVCPRAWVDHDIGHSDQFLRPDLSLREGPYPDNAEVLSGRRVPQWLLREIPKRVPLSAGAGGPSPRRRGCGTWRTWGRRSVAAAFPRCSRPVLASGASVVGHLPAAIPNNRGFQPVLRRAGAELVLDGITDVAQLNFGWYDAERDGVLSYRWTDMRTSAFFSLSAKVGSVSVTLRASIDVQNVTLIIRRAGEIAPEVQVDCTVHVADPDCAAVLRPGLYELLLIAERGVSMAGPCGPAVASVVFR